MQIVEPLLGTRAEVHASAPEPSLARTAEDAVITEAARLEQLFTVFDPTSALNDLRRTGSTAVPELIEVLDLAADWHRKSQSAFDPRTQLLVELWDSAEALGSPPSADAMAAALVARDHAGFAADNLNAIAKGWIAQRAVNVVEQLGLAVDSVWLSLGGDIAHVGTGSMTVGIENPLRPYDNVAPLAQIEISNEAVATSGGSRQWWTIEGRRYPKVLDPRTGWPVERVASATVIATDAAVADVVATIATVANTDETLVLADTAGVDCLLVFPDGSHACTSTRFSFD